MENAMKKQTWTLFPLIACLVLVSACQPKVKVDAEPVLTTPVVETFATTNTPEINNLLPATEATAEPTFFDNTGETIQTWTGTIESLPAGSQFNDQFKSDSLNAGVCGIDGNSDGLKDLITQYSDSGSVVSIQGVLFADVPDVNGCQIRVTSLEVE
jgi:hypothetical protein